VSEYLIYHNPRCSKSRATLALLREHGVEPEIVLYLQQPLSVAALKRLLGKLGITAAEWVRHGEPEFKAAGLQAGSSAVQILNAMAAHPKLIGRPVVVRGERAVLGRPPENVLGLFD
jgi:arsenate reductase (glutaredoxin)